jgi:hypothetical protein
MTLPAGLMNAFLVAAALATIVSVARAHPRDWPESCRSDRVVVAPQAMRRDLGNIEIELLTPEFCKVYIMLYKTGDTLAIDIPDLPDGGRYCYISLASGEVYKGRYFEDGTTGAKVTLVINSQSVFAELLDEAKLFTKDMSLRPGEPNDIGYGLIRNMPAYFNGLLRRILNEPGNCSSRMLFRPAQQKVVRYHPQHQLEP